MQSYIKNRLKLWELIQFKGSKSVPTVLLGALTDFRCTLHKMKSTFIKLHNESLPKAINQELLIVNNSV